MNGRDLLNGLNDIEDELVEAAEAKPRRHIAPRQIFVLAACLCVLLLGGGWAAGDIWGARLVKTSTGLWESGYRMEAEVRSFSAEDFSPQVREALDADWEKWESMDPESQTLSSWMPGMLFRYFDTWEEAEAFLGISLDNPLEDVDWLEKGTHFGGARDDPGLTTEDSRMHCKVVIYDDGGGEAGGGSVSAGYLAGDIRVTLSPSLQVDGGVDAHNALWNGPVGFRTDTYRMRDGQSVIIVSEKQFGKSGYISQDAFFIWDGLLYDLHLVASAEQEEELRQVTEDLLDCFGA